MGGRTIAHYTILEKLGEGGMGVVYKARDTHLDRLVAIKVLPAEKVADPQRKRRFVQEAKAASALNHPNIITIHDVGTADGVTFIAMEYVKGKTLDRLIREKGASLTETLNHAVQMADALAAAHAAGIIHRDIKPANIMVSETGQVKVLDFGLAKATEMAEPGEEQVTRTLQGGTTQEGTILGTVAYMSPEQVRAEALDQRTDLFSFGLVLYEMATGRRAFAGESLGTIVDGILNRVPTRALRINPELPPELEKIIDKSLEKERNLRYQTAADLKADLERLKRDTESGHRREPSPGAATRSGSGVSVRYGSIAVLPLENLSGDPEQGYLADGMTETLITELGKIGALRVVSRTSAMRFRRTQEALPEVARQLNVDAVLEGSMLRSGSRVRITANLIDGKSDHHIWGESYERDFGDVLSLQRDLARAIARAIHVSLTPEEQERLAETRRVNPEAYEACLKGRFHWYKQTPEDLDTALEYYHLALEKDPGCALAYSGIAAAWLMRENTGVIFPREAYPRVRSSVTKALELEDTLADGHVFLAFVHVNDWNWAAAEDEFQRALDLNPNYADAHLLYSDFLISVGRTREAIAEIERARTLDPLNPFFICFMGWYLLFAGRLDEAIVELQKTVSRETRFAAARLGLWGAYYRKHKHEEALAEAKEFFTLLKNPEIVDALKLGAKEGGYAGGMKRAAATLEASARETYVPAMRIARLYAHAEEKSRALDWLEKAYEERESTLLHLKVGWDWESLRHEPRFQALLRRINFPE